MRIKLLILISIFASTSAIAYAADSQLHVNLDVTGPTDVISPTQPTGLTANVISSSQIDLSWTASTDNVGVTGYRIYREGVLIDTTSLTSYSDINLISNTLYHYKVSAVDGANNESLQSTEASATTLKGKTNTSGGGVLLPIYEILVVPNTNSVKISWKTNTLSLGTIMWGTTHEYADATIKENSYSLTHEVELTDLVPGTIYYFKITSDNGKGLIVTLDNQSFKTLGLLEGIPNPDHFRVLPQPKSLLLTWINPRNPNFEEVRIVRNSSFYPIDQLDGETVFRGTTQSFEDKEVEIGKTYYYTIFAKDKNGNYSSGVIGSAVVGGTVNESVPQPDFFDSLPKAPSVDPRIQGLTFADFDFIQDGKKINTTGTADVLVNGLKNLTIKIDYDKIPEVLKSIVVTMKDPEDKNKVFSFLLRVNEEKTAYVATIAPFGRQGLYSTRIAIVDFKNRGLKATDGNMSVEIALANSREGKGMNTAALILIGLIALTYVVRKVEKRIKSQKVKNVQGI